MKNLTWQNPEQLFVAQELINKVKSKCCGIKDLLTEGHDCCDMLCWCQQSIHNNVIVDDRCINTPWERCADNNLCPYATLWKHWNLSGYSPQKT